jgi:outer membrane lipoprotein SlyB
MKTNQKPDKRIHIRKKVAGGTTGAVLGAFVGGPVGALVGGVIGTTLGGAAESGKLSRLTQTTAAREMGNKTSKTVHKLRAKPRQSIKRIKEAGTQRSHSRGSSRRRSKSSRRT